MAAQNDRLTALLAVVYNPAAPAHDKRAAEAELQALGRTSEALEWALGALHSAADPQALFFACMVVDETVHYRWSRLGSTQREAVCDVLWQGATEPGRPHFVRSKLASSLAHVAALDWPVAYPEFWPALQACLADPARVEAGINLLAAALDHFQSLVQASSAALNGKVPSSAIPGIQRRFAELQPVAISTLCSLLHNLGGSMVAAVHGGDIVTLAVVARALRALRHALADASRLPEEQGISSAAVTALLFDLVAAAAQAQAGLGLGSSVGYDDAAAAAADEVAAAALNCVTELCGKYFGTAATQTMLQVLVPRLQATCSLVQQRWAHNQHKGAGSSGGTGAGHCDDDWLLAALVRLLANFFAKHLSSVEATPALAAALQGLLSQVLVLSTIRTSPLDMLLFLEVWHAVLGHLDGLEGQLWEVEDSPEAQEAVRKAAAAYKEPVLAVADLLLSVLCPVDVSTAAQHIVHQQLPFGLEVLSSIPGSGTAMDDWLLLVASGGEGPAGGKGEAEEQQHSGAGEMGGYEEHEEAETEYAEEVLVPGVAQRASRYHSQSESESEADVFVRHAEGFLGRAIGSFSGDMLPRVLLRFQAAAAAFQPACQQAAALVAGAAAASSQGGAPPSASASGLTALAGVEQLLPAFRATDICLRLLTRCAPNFPLSGAAAGAALDKPLAATGGGSSGTAITGSHAVHSLQVVFQLAASWLPAVQAIAAVAPAPAALVQGGGNAGLAGMVLAGSRLHKAAGSLVATWLSQLVMGLMQGSADPDAAPVAQALVQGTLSSAASLLQAFTSSALAGWRPELARAALWAAESLLSLTSIVLSSTMRPPSALLEGVWGSAQVQEQLLPTAHACLNSSRPALLPVRASRALWLGLSDLSLRCWGSQPAAQFSGEGRGAAYASLVAPLLQLLQQAASSASQGGDAADVAPAVRQAAAITAGIVQSFAGSPKAVRGIVSSRLVAPALPSVLANLHRSVAAAPGSSTSNAGGQRSKAAAALLRLVSAAIEVLGTELGTGAVEQVLSGLVHIFATSTPGGDPTFASDLLLMRLVVSILSQGGTQRHAALVMPALQYCLGVWERTALPQAAAGAGTAADPHHVRAAALAALLSLLRYRWRMLAVRSSGTPQQALAPAGTLPQQAAAAAAAAAAALQSGTQAAAADADAAGAAAIARVLHLLLEYFSLAGSLRMVLAAADVRLVLEELYELQVSTRLFMLPVFQPLRAPLAAALLSMLLSRLYVGAQEDLVDTLFSLASANWSDFHLAVLPAFVEQWLGGGGSAAGSGGAGGIGNSGGPRLGPSERAALLALFGETDLNAHSFERCLLAFINDATYYQRAAA